MRQPQITVFIDEAGDPGLREGVRFTETPHQWLTLGAAVLRTENEAQSVEWVKDMREAARARQTPDLHYARIGVPRREEVCRLLAQQAVRGFCLLSHKQNLRTYYNARLGRFVIPDTYYNWCVRVLLERVKEWCASHMLATYGELSPLRIVFSERGGHNYSKTDGMFDYFEKLNRQYRANRMKLKPRFWEPILLDRRYIAVERANTRAGLQLADVIASAFYQGVNDRSPSYDVAPARALARIMPKDQQGRRADFSVSVWPLFGQAPTPSGAKPLLSSFGHEDR
jgi:hypothetical protein